jgi:hypothetical protein
MNAFWKTVVVIALLVYSVFAFKVVGGWVLEYNQNKVKDLNAKLIQENKIYAYAISIVPSGVKNTEVFVSSVCNNISDANEAIVKDLLKIDIEEKKEK